TVSGGATLDARDINPSFAPCAAGWCNNFIGNAAGSDATFTVTGAGSNASFLKAFVVGGLAVFRPPADTFTFGTPGGSTTGRINVLAGGSLTTDQATLGVGPGGSSPTGTETSTAVVVVDGVGSVWRVTGGTLDNSAASVSTATHANATATIDITNGGQMRVEGKSGVFNVVNLSAGGGQTAMTIAGAGSNLLFTGVAGVLQVGRSGAGGSASLVVSGGGLASGMANFQVGRDGSSGTVTVRGIGSEVLINGTASAAAGGGLDPSNAYMAIGRNGGSGTVNVTDGGKITMVGQLGNTPNLTVLDVGRDSTSTGILNIGGPGSVVSVSQASVVPGGGPSEALNPLVRLGRDGGSGTLNIIDGGKLLIDGRAVSTVADTRQTRLNIGGNGSTLGGTGVALVSGAGSEIRLTGSDTLVVVGSGSAAAGAAISSGTLTVQNGASVSSIGMLVGNLAATGAVNVNNASLNFSGQETGNLLSGAFLSIGRDGGTGTVNVTNGGVVNLTNPGSAGAALNLGGTLSGPTGNGTLNVTDSTVNVTATGGTAQFRVGRDGTGTSTFTNSTLNVSGATANDSRVIIAQLPGSTGTLTLNAGSVINAGYVGVGATPSATVGVQNPGGAGNLILNNSTVNTTTFEIGKLGVLSGDGGVINATGDVIVGGKIGPGNSPGSLRINCNLISLDGSQLVLEIQSNGIGGFNTDRLIIGDTSTFDLSNFQIVFSFLGDTDPTAFAASGGFDLDKFLLSGHFGAGAAEPDALSTRFATGQTWANVVDPTRISAVSSVFDVTSLTFDAGSGGVTVTVAAIPEPSTWALMVLGLLSVVVYARRRQRAALAS
ncbi:MAG: PEP-CTERM sorting domain-containing protein, partial [Burkholderiaceae bacterium]